MKGTYTVLSNLCEDYEIQVGKLGGIEFKEGGYAYVGSGLNNLDKRIERHLRDEKNTYWHIDYFLKYADIDEVWYGEGGERKECIIAESLADKFSYIDKFGSSDCNCKSHLFYSKDISKLRKNITLSFRKAGLEPKKW